MSEPRPPYCCPRTGQALRMATQEEAAALERLRAQGQLSVESPDPQYPPGEPFTGVLIREDGEIGYGIINGIPVLLPDHGFPLNDRFGPSMTTPAGPNA